jgi:hypothetical protein
MGDANVWSGFGEAVKDLVENMRLWARMLESADFGTDAQAAEDAHNVRVLIKAQISDAAKLRDQIFDQVTEERDEAARQAAKIKHAASICEHPSPHVVIYNDLVDPPRRLSVGWCPDCGAYSRKHPMGGVFDGKWHPPEGYAKLLAQVREQGERPVAAADGDIKVQWNHDGAGHPTRIVSVTVGDKRFVPDASVTDTDDWAANVAAANATPAPKGDVRAPPKQNTFVDDLLWQVFSTADSSDLWGHARREIDIFRSAVRRVLDKHGIDTSGVWPAISAAQAQTVTALKSDIGRLQDERRLDGKIFENLNDALTNAGVPCVAITLVEAVNRIIRERDSKAGTVGELLKDIDNRNRVITERDAEIERLNRMLDEKSRIIEGLGDVRGLAHERGKTIEALQVELLASLARDEGIPLNELPDDLRDDMQAMDVAEAKSQLASDEGLKVARVLVAKLRKKYDQDVVQGIVDDLIRTKQTGAGLHGLSPGEKEFVCLSRVHIADDPTPRIPVFFSGSHDGRRPPVQVPSAVDHPAHYGGADNPYEAIKVIEAWNLEFCTGSAVKYIARAGKKDATKLVEDLQKAVWYLRRRIGQLGGADDANTASLVRRLFEIYDRPCKPDGSWEHVAEYEAIEKKVRVLVGAPPSNGSP